MNFLKSLLFCFSISFFMNPIFAQYVSDLDQTPINIMDVYTENFTDNTKKWDLFDDNISEFAMENGMLLFWGKKDDVSSIYAPSLVINPSASSYLFEVKTSWVSGDDSAGFGLGWDAGEKSSRYQFYMTACGFYEFEVWENDSTNFVLTEWTPSPFINPRGTNILRVQNTGTSIKLAINGHILESETEGLKEMKYVFLGADGVQKVAFDDFRLANYETEK